MQILIKNVRALLPEGAKTTNIFVTNDKISAITDTLPDNFSVDTIIDGKDKLATPGLVNTHTHISMTLLRSYADDMKLMDWLQNKIWPIEAKMKKEDIYWGAMLGIAEMLASGTTTFSDMYADMEKVAEAVEESGIRAVLARGMIGVAPNGEQALAENCALYEDFNGAADGRITVMFGPHAPYTCPLEFLQKVIAKAEKYDAPIHIHLAETQEEVENCQKEYQKTPVALLEKVGVFNRPTLAAHCVHLTEKDMEIMRKYDVKVAHNPSSNLKLASGIAPVPQLLNRGICVSLGTDGASSNNNLDMLEEVNLAALIHKANNYDPLAIPAGKAWQLGTECGAEALFLPEIGSLAVGKKADIVLWDTTGTKWQPQYDMTSLLVYSASSSSVDTVLVNGEILLQGKEYTTLDIEKIRHAVDKSVERLGTK